MTDASYLKEMPPEPSSSANATSSTDTEPVWLSVEVLSILSISEVGNSMALQFALQLAWRDKRLTMLNLNAEVDRNTLTAAERRAIWLPNVVFYNTEDKWESENDGKAFVTVDRQGGHARLPLTALHSAYIYKGEDNPLAVSRVYSHSFLCDFDMSVYPFDRQSCSAAFVMKGNSGRFARLAARDVAYSGPVDLTQYFVEDFGIADADVADGVRGVRGDLCGMLLGGY